MEFKRLFIAIPVPESVKLFLLSVKEKAEGEKIRWTASENLHVTVFFLGKTNTEDMPVIEEQSDRIARASNDFELCFRHFRTIYRSRQAVMVWAEFEIYEPFSNMVMQFRQSFGSKEQKPPIPHITLARFKKGGRLRQQFNPEYVDKKIVLPVNRIELWESKLSPEGAVYTTLKSYSLRRSK